MSIAILAVLVLVIAGGVAAYALRTKPVAAVETQHVTIEVYSLPGWRLRVLPKSSGFLVFSNETGWMGHGTSKYIKDRADFQLHNRIEELCPIAPGAAVSLPVQRLPARRVVVANVNDEQSLTGRAQFSKGFSAGVEEIVSHGGHSMTMKDPTDDWNYFTSRTDAEGTARLVMDNILKNRGRLKTVRILVTDPANAAPYARIVNELSEERWKYVNRP